MQLVSAGKDSPDRQAPLFKGIIVYSGTLLTITPHPLTTSGIVLLY